jgi:hypothetical protein
MSRDKGYLVIDFETNGMYMASEHIQPNQVPLPHENHPTQVSVEIVERGVLSHAFDCYVRGATQLTRWVQNNVPVTLEQIDSGESLENVIAKVAGLIDDRTIVVGLVGNSRRDRITEGQFDRTRVMVTDLMRQHGIGFDRVDFSRLGSGFGAAAFREAFGG